MTSAPEFTEDQMARGVTLLASLKGLAGFPPDRESLRGTARSFLRIVKDGPQTYLTAGDKEREVPNDAEWLVEIIRDSCEFFPRPIAMRKLYERRFRPADGRSSESLEGGG